MYFFRAVEPSHEKVTLDWYNKSGKVITNEVQQAPIKLPPVFNRQVYSVYGLIDSFQDISRVVLTVF